MKKVINKPENYVNEMLEGLYIAHSDLITYTNEDLRCLVTANKVEGKVGIAFIQPRALRPIPASLASLTLLLTLQSESCRPGFAALKDTTSFEVSGTKNTCPKFRHAG